MAALSAGELGQGGGHGGLQKHEEVEGFRFPLLPRAGAKRGGGATMASGRRAAALVVAALWDAVAARAGGRSTRGSRGVDSLTYSELGQREVVARLGPTVGGHGSRGGSAGRLGSGLEFASDAKGPFIDSASWWRDGAWWPSGRRASRRTLMPFWSYRGVVERRHGRRGGHRTTGRLGQARAARRASGVHRDARGWGAERERRVFRARGARARVEQALCVLCGSSEGVARRPGDETSRRAARRAARPRGARGRARVERVGWPGARARAWNGVGAACAAWRERGERLARREQRAAAAARARGQAARLGGVRGPGQACARAGGEPSGARGARQGRGRKKREGEGEKQKRKRKKKKKRKKKRKRERESWWKIRRRSRLGDR